MNTIESTSSTHCYCACTALEEYMIICTVCKKKFHLSCLKSGRPSPLAGDVYFTLTCENCATDGTEVVKRMKLQWTLVIMLALYNLQLEGSGKCGYFRWRENICRFIDKHWSIIFGSDRKKSATWHGTVAGALSTGANRFFTSGFEVLGETGWWSLKSSRMPPINELDSIALSLKSNRKRKNPSEPQDLLVEGCRRKHTNIVEAAVSLKEKKSHISNFEVKAAKPKKKSSDSKAKKNDVSIFPPNHKLKLVVASTSSVNQPKEDNINVPKIIIKTERLSPSLGYQYNDPNLWSTNLGTDFDMPPITDMYNIPSALNVPDSYLNDVISEMNSDSTTDIKQECESDEDMNSDKTVGTPKKAFPDTSRKRTVVTKEESPVKEMAVSEPKFDLISLYEEESILLKLENYPGAMSKNSELRQLYRKLKVRKIKRELNLPVFDLDAEVRMLRGMDPPDYSRTETTCKTKEQVAQAKKVLDRYQVSSSNIFGKSQKHVSFVMRLMGRNITDLESIVSPYSGRILKPIIYEDYSIKPLKLKLLEELLCRTNKDNPDWISPKQSPIDFCYVRPELIPAINDLCHEFFWPGIDMSECLQYPDFSCVALYRKVIVGFAFMVPDAKYNEAYITFIFCHPEWRRCGIASFMLYHLIQTCMGKDITLHVSATSSAVLFYKKFNFVIEEFIFDFYDKYLPTDSTECRHAYFLRLPR